MRALDTPYAARVLHLLGGTSPRTAQTPAPPQVRHLTTQRPLVDRQLDITVNHSI